MPPKRTRAEKEAALELMEKELVRGRLPSEVVRAAAAKWSISVRAAEYDLAEIRARWAAAGKQVIVGCARARTSLMLVIRRHDYLYGTALEQGDLRTALAVEKSLCKLLGLYDVAESLRQEARQQSPPGADTPSGTKPTWPPDPADLAPFLKVIDQMIEGGPTS
jgi:hypothetical protein